MRFLLGLHTARPLIIALPLVVFAPGDFGQLPKRLEECLPYPTLAQEIQERQPKAEHELEHARVHVVRVDFDADDGIPADAREEIANELDGHVFPIEGTGAFLVELSSEIAEVVVRGAFRNRGYFMVSTTANLTEQWNEGADVYVAAGIHATPGPQFRVGNIRVESADPDTPLVMSPEVLRGFIPLQPGELFSVERVRTGLENLGRVYGRQGYIDMTPEPETQIDQARKTIDLIVKIDQQVQYRVRSIEFLGVSKATQDKLMESLPKPGEILDRAHLDEFFRVNRATLPSDASEGDMSLKRNNKERTVEIVFDLRTCPSNSN